MERTGFEQAAGVYGADRVLASLRAELAAWDAEADRLDRAVVHKAPEVTPGKVTLALVYVDGEALSLREAPATREVEQAEAWLTGRRADLRRHADSHRRLLTEIA